MRRWTLLFEFRMKIKVTLQRRKGSFGLDTFGTCLPILTGASGGIVALADDVELEAPG